MRLQRSIIGRQTQLLDNEIPTLRPIAQGNFCTARVTSRISSGQPLAGWRDTAPKRCRSVPSVCPYPQKTANIRGIKKKKVSRGRKKARKATARCKADFRALLPTDSSIYNQPSPEISPSRAEPFSCWGRLRPPSTILGLVALLRSIVEKKRGRVPFFSKRRCASAQTAAGTYVGTYADKLAGTYENNHSSTKLLL